MPQVKYTDEGIVILEQRNVPETNDHTCCEGTVYVSLCFVLTLIIVTGIIWIMKLETNN